MAFGGPKSSTRNALVTEADSRHRLGIHCTVLQAADTRAPAHGPAKYCATLSPGMCFTAVINQPVPGPARPHSSTVSGSN